MNYYNTKTQKFPKPKNRKTYNLKTFEELLPAEKCTNIIYLT